MSFYKKVPGFSRTLESELLFDKTPTKGSTNPVTSEGVSKAFDNILDDGVSAKTIVREGKDFYDNHDEKHFYIIDGKIYRCTGKLVVEGVYSTTLVSVSGIVEALNQIVDDEVGR